jgi:hypothetical protein
MLTLPKHAVLALALVPSLEVLLNLDMREFSNPHSPASSDAFCHWLMLWSL